MAMDGLTGPQKKRIRKNYNSFVNNYGEPRIQRSPCGGGALLVYWPADANDYIQYCENIDYLNGWLYGCVQARYKLVPVNT